MVRKLSKQDQVKIALNKCVNTVFNAFNQSTVGWMDDERRDNRALHPVLSSLKKLLKDYDKIQKC